MEDPIRLLEDRVGRAAERIDGLKRERKALVEQVGAGRDRVAILERENEELRDRIAHGPEAGNVGEIVQVLKTAIEELREDD